MSIRKTLGKNICALREAHSMSQDQLAKAVNSSLPTISRYETGHIQRPDSELLQTIAEFFKVEVSDLYDQHLVVTRQYQVEITRQVVNG